MRLLVTGSSERHVLALGSALNEHPRVVLGVRRFSSLGGSVDGSLLDPRWIAAPLSAETEIRADRLYSRLQARIAGQPPTVVGDIDPDHVRLLADLSVIPGGLRAIVTLARPVAAGLPQWRHTVAQAMRAELTSTKSLLVLDWHALAEGDERWYRALLLFLGIGSTARLEAECARMGTIEASSAPDLTLLSDADERLCAWLDSRFKAELRRESEDPRTLERLDDPPLTTAELATRQAEREEILRQWQEGSSWPDQGATLTERYRGQIAETVRRGRIISRREVTAVRNLPDPALKVNLVAATVERAPIGRNDSIALLARHLSRLCTVRVIADGSLGRLSGSAQLLDARHPHPDCDAVIYLVGEGYPPELPPRTRRIAWLDGLESMSDQELPELLAHADTVLASSPALCHRARALGIPALQLPPGIEPELLEGAPPNAERALLVTGIAEVAAHTHCHELSEAMVTVRERRPEVDVTLFGGVPADGATAFLLHPTMVDAAEALRSSAVHVNLGAEAFGYLDVVAMACGAALVTTNTVGIEEYAFAGRTAAVLASIEPGAVADCVLGLLDDVDRRAALAEAGRRVARTMLRPWPEIARAVALTLLDI